MQTIQEQLRKGKQLVVTADHCVRLYCSEITRGGAQRISPEIVHDVHAEGLKRRLNRERDAAAESRLCGLSQL